jgi:hypothetical protein
MKRAPKEKIPLKIPQELKEIVLRVSVLLPGQNIALQENKGLKMREE